MQHFAELKITATDRADTTTEDLDMGADHLVGTAAHHHREADVLIAQPDIAHIASTDIDKSPHHITSTLLQLQNPAQHQTVTQKIYRYNLKMQKQMSNTSTSKTLYISQLQ